MALTVKLNRAEALEAAVDGCKRRIESKLKGREDHIVAQDDPWEKDIEGAIAEIAFAKAMGLFWGPSFGRFSSSEGDVCGWEVRRTAHESGHLLLRDRDRDEAPYVLVTGQLPNYSVVGYMLGRDGKREKYSRNPGGRGSCFLVPQSALVPLKGDEGRWRG